MRIQISIIKSIVSVSTSDRKKKKDKHVTYVSHISNDAVSYSMMCVFFFPQLIISTVKKGVNPWDGPITWASCSHRKPENRQDYWQVLAALFSARAQDGCCSSASSNGLSPHVDMCKSSIRMLLAKHLSMHTYWADEETMELSMIANHWRFPCFEINCNVSYWDSVMCVKQLWKSLHMIIF